MWDIKGKGIHYVKYGLLIDICFVNKMTVLLEVWIALSPGYLPADLPRSFPGGGVALLLQPRVAPHLNLLPVLNLLRGLTQGAECQGTL